MTMVEGTGRCIVGWRVGQERSESIMQGLVDEAPQALFYFSDDVSSYSALIDKPGLHRSLNDKSQTYCVEGDNAELRHYLARLGRKSRCFSRCLSALRRAITLFVYAWNRRQLYRQRFPNYPAHLFQSLYP